MKIALDWDGTVTADPELWGKFIEIARERGHEVTIVTWRSMNEGILPQVPVVYCSRKAKIKRFQADIWIDDNPRSILEDECPAS